MRPFCCASHWSSERLGQGGLSLLWYVPSRIVLNFQPDLNFCNGPCLMHSGSVRGMCARLFWKDI
jgi:hypothetical protein